MAGDPHTMRVMPAHPSQGEWVVINADDFDPVIHVEYDEHAVADDQASTPAQHGRPPKNPPKPKGA